MRFHIAGNLKLDGAEFVHNKCNTNSGERRIRYNFEAEPFIGETYEYCYKCDEKWNIEKIDKEQVETMLVEVLK